MVRVDKKSAEVWANKVLDEYIQSEEYKQDMDRYDIKFLDYMIYGKGSVHLDEEILYSIKTEFLNVDAIIERYNLTEKEVEEIKKINK